MKKLLSFDEGCAKQSNPAKTPGSGVYGIKNVWVGIKNARIGTIFSGSGVFLGNCQIFLIGLWDGFWSHSSIFREEKRERKREEEEISANIPTMSPNPNSTQREHASCGFCCKFHHLFRLNSLCCSKL